MGDYFRFHTPKIRPKKSPIDRDPKPYHDHMKSYSKLVNQLRYCMV